MGWKIMIFFPAIDIQEGKCVRLQRGLLSNLKVYNEDPIEQAILFKSLGCEWIHVVDIDAAFTGAPKNYESIFKIKKYAKCRIQLGGGIRNLKTVENLISHSIDRIILGTVALKDPDFVRLVCEKYSDRITIGVDSKDGMVATEGWKTTSTTKDVTFIKQLEKLGVKRIVSTDINRDGVLKGMNLKKINEILKETSVNVIASGGVTSYEDLEKLKKIENERLEGVIAGKAIYENLISVKKAIELLK
ncbi:MAG: 1-(5-phosphoribosyl)-5-[(5-phosphoribosylamino)methylideneamino]imidazole-4-carboxamide isomerase [Rickettsiales bacterium]|nr:1-(5-phosphoribosyl)-5-[(5-phosphoribosylamino)methylideneamino]imidazole-4-carboxamide isomerase [Rickettsiales bacterium]OUV54779.1 MAG: 1-(5-phosphoribosyl)-5-[(5-phosphoribosylamino)methylideneamino]imidazole-4-carboxamide isomerase [Rickettsiales bacterium TMED127]|tara:strand:+ start:9222 stop:9959 length:738 start_codon:yes stop_codon:yes gene_type:complete